MTAPLPIQADDEGRWCSRCGLSKSPLAFGTRNRRGKTTSQPYCRDCMVAYHRDWRTRDGSAQRLSASKQKRRERYPERDGANQAVRRALVKGDLLRGPCCRLDADCAGDVEAHHDDYDRPLDVRWVCRKHHRALDRERQEAARRLSLGAGQ